MHLSARKSDIILISETEKDLQYDSLVILYAVSQENLRRRKNVLKKTIDIVTHVERKKEPEKSTGDDI